MLGLVNSNYISMAAGRVLTVFFIILGRFSLALATLGLARNQLILSSMCHVIPSLVLCHNLSHKSIVKEWNFRMRVDRALLALHTAPR